MRIKEDGYNPEQDLTPEDLAYINEPFSKKDLEYIASLSNK